MPFLSAVVAKHLDLWDLEFGRVAGLVDPLFFGRKVGESSEFALSVEDGGFDVALLAVRT